MAERLKQLCYTSKFSGEPSCKVLVSPGQPELQQDVSVGRGQPGSPQELSASGIRQAGGNGLSMNVSINCGEALVYYPFQLSGLAE